MQLASKTEKGAIQTAHCSQPRNAEKSGNIQSETLEKRRTVTTKLHSVRSPDSFLFLFIFICLGFFGEGLALFWFGLFFFRL